MSNRTLTSYFSLEELKRVQVEYDRIFDEIKDKHYAKLLKYYNDKYSFVNSTRIVTEKLMMLTKLRFEKELKKIYDPLENDSTIIARQNDLILCMLYATEIYLNQHSYNKSIV